MVREFPELIMAEVMTELIVLQSEVIMNCYSRNDLF